MRGRHAGPAVDADPCTRRRRPAPRTARSVQRLEGTCRRARGSPVVGRADGAGHVPGPRVDRLDLAAVPLGRPGVEQHPAATPAGPRPRRPSASASRRRSAARPPVGRRGGRRPAPGARRRCPGAPARPSSRRTSARPPWRSSHHAPRRREPAAVVVGDRAGRPVAGFPTGGPPTAMRSSDGSGYPTTAGRRRSGQLGLQVDKDGPGQVPLEVPAPRPRSSPGAQRTYSSTVPSPPASRSAAGRPGGQPAGSPDGEPAAQLRRSAPRAPPGLPAKADRRDLKARCFLAFSPSWSSPTATTRSSEQCSAGSRWCAPGGMTPAWAWGAQTRARSARPTGRARRRSPMRWLLKTQADFEAIDRRPAGVRAVVADDVPVVGEGGRDRRAAAPVPRLEERGVQGADLRVLRMGCSQRSPMVR